ncbi:MULTISPECIES: multidrug efflux SMR transporter [unclassified Microcoleus]|uniref:DMT family transporter n=1 Tax=unclassified Microcoleus TaxID=2642155 RepID=UPI002FD30555
MDSVSLICLVLAIIFEIAGTTCMKLSQGFTKILPSIGMFIFYGLCFTFLTISLKKIDLSVAYSIWSGLGTFLISLIGIFWFNESNSIVKLISLALIMIGVIGLNSGK